MIMRLISLSEPITEADAGAEREAGVRIGVIPLIERVEGGYARAKKIATPRGLRPVPDDACQIAERGACLVDRGTITRLTAERDSAAELELPLSAAQQIAHRHGHGCESVGG